MSRSASEGRGAATTDRPERAVLLPLRVVLQPRACCAHCRRRASFTCSTSTTDASLGGARGEGGVEQRVLRRVYVRRVPRGGQKLRLDGGRYGRLLHLHCPILVRLPSSDGALRTHCERVRRGLVDSELACTRRLLPRTLSKGKERRTPRIYAERQ